MKKHGWIIGASCAALILAVSCGGDEQGKPGSVKVKWAFEQGITCSEAETKDVVVKVEGSGGNAAATGRQACADMEATLEEVPVGLYRVVAEAEDDAGRVTFSGKAEPVRINSEALTEVKDPIVMSPKFGSILITWRIGPEPGKDCAEVGIVNVTAKAIDEAGAEVSNMGAPCSAGSVEVKYVEAGTYTVVVEGINADGRAIYRGKREQVKVATGQKVGIIGDIELSPKPATIHVTWRFENGEMCTTNGVSKLKITVAKGADQKDEQEKPCDSDYSLEVPELGDYSVKGRAYGEDSESAKFADLQTASAGGPGEVVETKLILKECGGEDLPEACLP